MSGGTYTRNGIGITITHMPYRKKPCLAIQEKGGVWKVASFNDEETAEWFAKKFEEWCGMSREESEC